MEKRINQHNANIMMLRLGYIKSMIMKWLISKQLNKIILHFFQYK